MKKTLTCLLILLVASSLTLTFAANVYGQTPSLTILDNYTFYEDSLGYLVVIGEVQNTGSSVIANATISGVITTDTLSASGSCVVWGNYLLPGQKAPFYMEFYPESQSYVSWESVTKSDITLAVSNAPETSQYQYQDVHVVSSEATPTATGEYWVTAELQNNGTQTAQGVLVVATFFNSEGLPVASGYINPISSLAAGSTKTVKVPAWDLNQTIVSADKKIAAYSLLVQVQSPIQTGGNIPVVSTDPTPIPGATSTSPGTTASSFDSTIIPAIVAVIVVVAVVAVLVVKRRKSSSSTNDEAFEPSRQAKKTRRERKKRVNA